MTSLEKTFAFITVLLFALVYLIYQLFTNSIQVNFMELLVVGLSFGLFTLAVQYWITIFHDAKEYLKNN